MAAQLRARDEPRIVLGQRYSVTITHVKTRGSRTNVAFGPAPLVYAAGDNRITYGLVSICNNVFHFYDHLFHPNLHLSFAFSSFPPLLLFSFHLFVSFPPPSPHFLSQPLIPPTPYPPLQHPLLSSLTSFYVVRFSQLFVQGGRGGRTLQVISLLQ